MNATETETQVEEQREMVEPDDPEKELETTADDDLEGDQPAEPKDALFDKKAYDSPALALPTVDGEGVDKIRIAFSGSVMLDRTDPADVALIRKMALGHDVSLMVEGKVSKKGHQFTTNKEGDLDAVVFETAVKVETVYTPVVPEA